MTQEEIIEMAKQCGIVVGYPKYQDIEAFAKLVAAKEREACAELCDELYAEDQTVSVGECVNAIRARGEQA